MKQKLVYLTPNEKVNKLVAVCIDGKWSEIYKGETVIANENWAKILINSYNMKECARPIVYKTIEEALANKHKSKRIET
jgi:hypothetical protein